MNNNIYFASPTLPLQESTGEAWGDWIDPRQQMWDTPDFGFAPGYFAQPSRIEDRADGNFLPYYQTEQELAQMRGISRAVVASGPIAIGVVNTLKNYVIGKGFTFCVQAKEDQEPPEDLVDMVQSVLCDLMEQNNFVNDLDKEIYGRMVEDGECVVTVERGQDGLAQFLIHEPDALTGPISPQVIDDYAYQQYGITAMGIPSFSYGVHTDKRRPDLPLGYHIVWGSGGQDWDYYPAFRVEHFKRNVSRNAKRGVSDYYQVWPWLLRSDKLHKNTIEGEAVRQAIAYVQQFPTGTTKTQGSAAGGMVTDGTRNIQGPTGPGIIRIRKHVPGSVVGLSPGLEYKDGPGSGSSSKAQGAVLIGNGILRMSGVRWSMPEYMITGDASNANLASSLTAESPFVKACEAEQETMAEGFECMLWKGLRMASDAGLFNKFGLKWEEIRKLLRIKVDPPAVATRDMLKLAQTHAIQLRNKTICRETAISEEGHDPKEEMPRIEEDAQEAQERAMQFQQQGLGPDGKPLPVQNKPTAGLLTGPKEDVDQKPVMESDQKRANVGGEYGVNGEWYEGGQFISTTDHAKSKARPKATGKQEIEPYVYDHGPDGHKSIYKSLNGVFAQYDKSTNRLSLRSDNRVHQTFNHLGAEPADVNKLIDKFNAGERWYKPHPKSMFKIDDSPATEAPAILKKAVESIVSDEIKKGLSSFWEGYP